MAIRTRSLAELNRDAFDHLLRNTEITLLTPGSIARALVESNNRTIEGLYESLAVNYRQSFLSEATGVYLDLHARMFGLSRIPARQARIQVGDHAIRFYVNQGTLGDYLPVAGDLNQGVIPEGTLATSDDGSIVYTVERNVTFARTATEVFVPARASTTGIGQNVGVGVLRNHNLGVSAVMVTNGTSITTGRDIESDDEFRSRIAAHLLAQQSSNHTAVRFAALSVPGVSDVIIDPHHYGAGSFKLLIIPTGNRVAIATLDEISNKVAGVVAFGTYFQVHEPKYRRFNIVISLRYGPETLQSEHARANTAVERAVLNYFGSIQPGAELVMTMLGNVIRDADASVYDYSVELLCLDGRHQLLHNVRLERDELFLPDTNLADPVRVI